MINKNDKEVETWVLGNLLLYPQNLNLIAPILKDEYFYQKENQIVYRAIKSVFNKSNPVDYISVASELNLMGRLKDVGGSYFLVSLTNGAISPHGLENKVKLLTEFYLLREIEMLGLELTQLSATQNADCFDLIDKINKKMSELTSFATSTIKTFGEVFSEMTKEIGEVIEKGLPTGLLSGFENVDNITGGWQNGNLIILAARPGMGKTALALQLAKHPAFILNKPVAIFSMEMTAIELVGRVASSESGIGATRINQKKINKEELQLLAGKCFKLIDAPIYIDDTSGLTISDLRAKAKKLVYEQKIEMIIIDYLQLMSGEAKGNREQEISFITRSLKTLAKELNLPIICLSQLSRKCEERPDKRPMLSDLRESGAIEQDADIVAFIFRPEYYELYPNGYEYGDTVLKTENLMLLDFAKGRGLKICEVPLKFYGEFMLVDNYNLGNSKPLETKPLDNNDNFLNESKGIIN